MKHNPQASSCQHVRLTHSQVGDVLMCPDCGVVHVFLRYFSVRFDLDAFQVLAQMLGKAQDKIQSLKDVSRLTGEAVAPSTMDELPGGSIH